MNHKTPYLIVSLLVLAVPNAGASDIHFHERLTIGALEDLNWGNPATRIAVGQASMAVDFAHRPEMFRRISAYVMPGVGLHFDHLDDLTQSASFSAPSTRGFHFNSVYTYDDITQRWAEFDSWVDETAGIFETEQNPEKYIAFLGAVAHHVQDFYAHANWVGIIAEVDSNNLDKQSFPLWCELIDNKNHWRDRHPGFPSDEAIHRMKSSNFRRSDREELGGLQTGSIVGEHFESSAPWSHRHHIGTEMDVVHHLAQREIARYVSKIETLVHEAQLSAE
jgi:hypothetical protein